MLLVYSDDVVGGTPLEETGGRPFMEGAAAEGKGAVKRKVEQDYSYSTKKHNGTAPFNKASKVTFVAKPSIQILTYSLHMLPLKLVKHETTTTC